MFRIPFRISFFSLLALALLQACAPALEVEPASAGPLNFDRVVFAGGHYLGGYRNGAVNEKSQTESVAGFLYQQMSGLSASANQNLGEVFPMVKGDGFGLNLKPWESDFQSPARLGYRTDCEGVSGLSPLKTLFNASAAGSMLDPLASHTWLNFATPFATSADWIDPNAGLPWPAGNPWYHRFATNPGTSTLLNDAASSNPSFYVAWIGMEDIYEYASTGGMVNNLADAATFGQRIDSILSRFSSSGAKGIIANIPHLSTQPYFTTVAWNGLNLTQNKADSLNDIYAVTPYDIQFSAGANGFVIQDPAATGGYRKMVEGEYITLSVPVDSIKCFYMGIVGIAIPDRYLLDSAEMSFLNTRLAEYNNIIAAKAAAYSIPLVDMNNWFQALKSGIKWDGVDYNSTFVSGNFYSLDGYSPTAKGAALLANEFIKSLNEFYGCNVYGIETTDLDANLFP